MPLPGNAGAIASFLSSLGFTQAGTAGTLGAFQSESGLNPKARNASSGATGIAQWLGSRLRALEELASRMGQPTDSLTVQEAYFRQEITSPQYSGLLHELQTTNDPQQAARDFVNTFERPGPGGDASAPRNAQVFFSGGVPGPTGSTGTGGTTGQPVSGGTPDIPIPTPFGVFTLPQVTGPINGFMDIIHPMLVFFQDVIAVLNAFLSLFRPSFWLRVGAFLVGLLLLIGGFVTLKGAAL